MNIIETIRAEIERRSACEGKQIEDNIKQGFNIEPCHEYALSIYQGLLDFLDTLETEERGKEPATIAFERLHGLNSKK